MRFSIHSLLTRTRIKPFFGTLFFTTIIIFTAADEVFFDPGHYTVMENIGQFQATVTRQGGDQGLSLTVKVDYKTEDGTAHAGVDYLSAQGTITFGPGDVHKTFTLEVIDNEEFEEDEHFYVRLSNMRVTGQRNDSGRETPSL